MTKKPALILSMTIIILILLCLKQTHSLTQQVRQLESTVANQTHQMRQDIRGISANVHNTLDEQANLLTDTTHTYGEISPETNQVNMIFSVTPKIFSPQKTQATIICNDQEYPMTLTGGTYTAHIPLPLFNESVISTVMFTEDGTIRTQQLEHHFSPRHDCLLTIYVWPSYHVQGTTEKDAHLFKYNGAIQFELDGSPQSYPIKSIHLVSLIDGKETDRIAVDITPEGQQKYHETQNPQSRSQNRSPASSASSAPSSTMAESNISRQYIYTFNEQSYPVPNGSTLILYSEAIDANGFYHRNIIDYRQVDSSGNLIPSEYMQHLYGAESNLYDQDGHIQYEAWPFPQM